MNYVNIARVSRSLFGAAAVIAMLGMAMSAVVATGNIATAGDQADPKTVEAILDIDVRSDPGTPVDDSSSGGSSGLDAQDHTSFLLLLFGLLGIGGLLARRKLEPVRTQKDK